MDAKIIMWEQWMRWGEKVVAEPSLMAYFGQVGPSGVNEKALLYGMIWSCLVFGAGRVVV